MKKISLLPSLTVAATLVAVGLPTSSWSQETSETGETVQIILQKATAARAVGDAQRERALLEDGIESTGPSSPSAWPLYQMLGEHHADYGNLVKAVEIAKHQLAIARTVGQELSSIVKAAVLYGRLNKKDKARDYVDRLDRLQPRLRTAPEWRRLGDRWQAATAWAKAHRATVQGHLGEAESAWKACLAFSESHLRKDPGDVGSLFYLVDCTSGLMTAHMSTGQLAAAGVFAEQQRAAIERISLLGRPAISTRLAGSYGRLALEQGRIDEARKIYLKALQGIESANAGDSSLRAASLRKQLAMADMLQGQWSQALEMHQERENALKRAKGERGNVGTASVEYAYTLVRLGKPNEAVEMLRPLVAARRSLYDDNSLYLWEGRAFLGVALAASGHRDEALRELQAAVPKVLDIAKGERSSSEGGVLRAARLNWLLESYIGLLADAAQGGDAEAVDEAFRMADLARGSAVQRALGAFATRANVIDPALADLARQEQDLQREISSLSDSISDLLARGRIAEQDEVVAEMRADIVMLRGQHDKAQAEIERRYPDYFALLNPKPVGIAAIQKLLIPTEAVVSVYTGTDRTFVWALPAQGWPSFTIVPLGAEQLDRMVQNLRQALDPENWAQGRPPEFRFDVAHELYQRLLAPVEAGWKGAHELIVIPHRRLGQLPFGVMTTAPFHSRATTLPYAEMADAPWLIKQVAISQLPAALGVPGLRAARTGKAERAFIGFGDPVFVAENQQAHNVGSSRSADGLHRRNLLVMPEKARTKNDSEVDLAPPIDFSLLPPLPDTALEIEEVATILSAEKGRDLYLQKRASEAQLKKTDLTRYRVVMFATHGLMNGEMPGVYQPALALSNPALSGDSEDGILTMEEILGLKLNADWVVLSACNSAAGDSASGESVSGLGRAFFYAGARSLLVTNWAVETESARMLTTEVFRRQAMDPGLRRSRALQQSSLSLMRQSAGSVSYAHPMFWAPYSLVGDGG